MSVFRVIAAIVLVGLVVALGAGVYQAGVVAGAAGHAGTAVVPYLPYGYGFGFGFGLFHLFGALLVLFLIFGLLRAVLWGGRRGGWGGRWGGYGPGPMGHGMAPGGPRGSAEWEDRIREYHDRLHASGETRSDAAEKGDRSAPGGA